MALLAHGVDQVGALDPRLTLRCVRATSSNDGPFCLGSSGRATVASSSFEQSATVCLRYTKSPRRYFSRDR